MEYPIPLNILERVEPEKAFGGLRCDLYLQKALWRVLAMARKEYTRIRVSKELHGALKSAADRTEISISNYIAELLRRNQARILI